MKTLYNKDQIKFAVSKISTFIWNRHKDDIEPPVMICVLNGAFMFFTDLVRSLHIDCEIDFVRVKSYQGQDQFEVKMLKDIELNITNKNVYIVDDILDSGNTINALKDHLSKQNPKSITPVVLFKKHKIEMECLFGFELTNEMWIYGYGLDNEQGLKRNEEVIFGFEPEID
jgi:hypoxanthine phosphoribosyltransferase